MVRRFRGLFIFWFTGFFDLFVHWLSMCFALRTTYFALIRNQREGEGRVHLNIFLNS